MQRITVLTVFAAAIGLVTPCACNHASVSPAQPNPVGQPTPIIKPTACFAITNGVLAQPQNFPAIVSVNTQDGSCTGTFVGTNAVLTAAHCIDAQQVSGGPPQGGLQVTTASGQTIAPTAVFFPKWAGESNAQAYDDLAILQMPQNSAPVVTKIASTTPAVGAKFTIAGFGTLTTDDQDGTTNPNNQLYSGANQIIALADDFIISVGESGTGIQSPTGQNSLGSFGDSGGPLFIGTDIVGIESSGSTTLTTQDFSGAGPFTDEENNQVTLPAGMLTSIEQEVQSGRKLATDYHTNLTFPAYMTWLQGLAAKGVDIEFDSGASGAVGSSANSCAGSGS